MDAVCPCQVHKSAYGYVTASVLHADRLDPAIEYVAGGFTVASVCRMTLYASREIGADDDQRLLSAPDTVQSVHDLHVTGLTNKQGDDAKPRARAAFGPLGAQQVQQKRQMHLQHMFGLVCLVVFADGNRPTNGTPRCSGVRGSAGWS